MRRYENVAIDKLKPYKNNAKLHPAKQVKQIEDSIEQFGFVNPVLIDGDYNIIAGHGRVLAAKNLDMESVPCIFVEDLTDEQKRAYILVDNKLTETAEWDVDLLNSELQAIVDIDMSAFGFDIDVSGVDVDLGEGYEFDEPNERVRTDNAYNLQIYNPMCAVGFYQMPLIFNDGIIPDRLIGFNYAKTSEDKQTGIHFYVDDYQFERVWNYPEKYIDVLSQYQCILSPDFSLYMDMPMAMKIWNVYRSRLIGQYYQNQGIKVIPTISWAENETYIFCFDGIEEGSIVSISTVGVKKSQVAMQIFRSGVAAMIEKIKPKAILVYGGRVEYDYGDIDVVYYDNEVTERMKVWADEVQSPLVVEQAELYQE